MGKQNLSLVRSLVNIKWGSVVRHWKMWVRYMKWSRHLFWYMYVLSKWWIVQWILFVYIFFRYIWYAGVWESNPVWLSFESKSCTWIVFMLYWSNLQDKAQANRDGMWVPEALFRIFDRGEQAAATRSGGA